MRWFKKSSSIEMPHISPVLFSFDCGYLKRILHWLFYTRKWQMVEDWYFVLFNGETILIPKGFQFDGTSIPKPFRFLLSPTGILFIPGIIHDYAYIHNRLVGATFREDGKRILFPYQSGAGKMCWDYLFKQIGHQVCKLYVIPYITWLTLVLFGFFAWYKHRWIR